MRNHPIPSRTLVLGLLTAFTAAAAAQTVTVTTLEDVSDFGGQKQIADLPGPDGRVSFREAILACQNTPGAQTIEFAIPTTEFWLIQNMALIKLEVAAFVVSEDGLVIDFSSQTRNIGDTNPSGPEVGIYGLEPNGWGSPAIIVNASDCTFIGLGGVWQRGAAIAVSSGHGNRIVGCQTSAIQLSGPFGGPAVTGNIVGGTTPEEANVLEAVEILCWADNNVVIGNRIRRVRVEGSTYCVFPTGNRIGGSTPEERNVVAGYGYYGEEGFPVGTQISVVWAKDTLIEGNYVGTTPDGMSRESQIGPGGIGVTDSINTTVRGNLVAGLRTVGVNHYAGQVFGVAIGVGATNRDNEGIVIEDNQIGLAADGVTPISTYRGIFVSPNLGSRKTLGTHIGGGQPGQGNIVAAVEREGILIASLANGVEIRGNSIHDCGSIGIELALNSGPDGPTPNDPLDADSAGGNRLQNFPVLATAESNATSTVVTGVLNSAANKAYRVSVFASPVCDPSGYGEGELYLGDIQVQTDAAGTAPFSFTAPVPVVPGWVATATATDLATLDTSEFSLCLAIAAGTSPGDMNCDGSINGQDISPFRLALSDPDQYAQQYPDCDIHNADTNGDGSVNGLDIQGFVELLLP